MAKKAVILVGGYGTRLRPMTLTCPKPLVEFCNKPILFHQIEALIDAGVTTIILAVSYMCEILEKNVKIFSENKNIEIIFSKEDEPLGTGGPLALARQYLEGSEPFFVLNSDVICIFPFRSLLKFHSEKNSECTIVITKVNEPSKYGVIVSDNNSKILKFIEKPQEFVSNRINAGIYLINPSVLDIIELRPVSIEKEVFPAIAAKGSLFSFDLEGFWMDIGQPHDYLLGSSLFLKYLDKHRPKNSGYIKKENISGLIEDSAIIGKDCYIEETVIGKDVIIGDGVCLKNCVILAGTVIKSHSYIEHSIIGWRCVIGKWVRIQECAALGEDVHVKDEVLLKGSKILPHKCITTSSYTPEILM